MNPKLYSNENAYLEFSYEVRMKINELNNQLISIKKDRRINKLKEALNELEKIFNDRIDKCNIWFFSKDQNIDEALARRKKINIQN